MPVDVESLRADTPGCSVVAHLNNAGSALPPNPVLRTVVAHLRREAEIGGYEAAAEAEDRVSATRDAVGRLVGAPAGNVALLESATEAWDRLLTALVHTQPLRETDRVLVSCAEYASNVIPLLQLAARIGFRVDVVPDGPDGTIDPAAIADMLDEHVRLVAVTHAPSQNGLINDVAAIGRALREQGSDAFYVVDACQSAGQVPLDLAGIGADALSATGRKFLRGPRGTGFLAVSDRVLDTLEPFPLDLWSGDWRADGTVGLVPNAQRFEHFERSYANLLGLGAAVGYALDCGIDTLQERIQELADDLRHGLTELPGVQVHDRGRHRSGIVTFTVSGTASATVVEAARAAGVNTSVSVPAYARHDFERHELDSVVRASVHAYNDGTDLRRLLDVVAAMN